MHQCVVFFILVMWNDNVIIFLHSSFWSKRILVLVFRRWYFIHLKYSTQPSSLCFLVRMIVQLKNRKQNHFFLWVTNQSQGTFHRCWCCWRCCSCRRTQSGSFTYATVFLFCNASLSSTLPWKRLEEFKSWTSCLMPYKWPHFQHKVFFVLWDSFGSASISLISALTHLMSQSPVKLRDLFFFWAERLSLRSPKEKHISSESTDRTRRRLR